MANTPITFTNITPNLPYCQLSDIMSLIGGVEPIADGTISTQQIQAAINAATSFVDNSTNRFFSPRRIISYLDGNGQGRLQLPVRPILTLNSVSIYVAYPLAISLFASDWNMRIDRATGTLSFPLGSWMPTLAPFASFFLEGSENVIVDATYGYSNVVYGEVLSSTDNTNFSFANPTAVEYSTISTATDEVPPSIYPIVYLNGVPLVNTIYQLQTNAAVYTQNIWGIATDNIHYTFKISSKGITGIIFNTPLAVGTVVTVDYPYWLIPADIIECTAKRTAITLLASIGTALLPDLQFQGATSVQMDGARIQWQAGGPWGEIIADWKTDIAATIANYKKLMLPYGLGRSGIYI
jgi:hypothetical protein